MQVDNFSTGWVFVTAYDDDPATPPEPKSPDVPAEPKVFKQEDIDKIVQERLARERQKHSEETTKLVKELETLRQSSTLTEEERGKLTEQIKTLRNQTLSVEEQKNREVSELQQRLKETEENLRKDAQRWQEDYFSFRVENELREAAVSAGARTPDQLVRLTKGDTFMKEVIGDDGKPTGAYKVVTRITEYKEDGTPFQVELSPAEAIKRLKAMPHIWGNQFHAEGKSGLDMMTSGNVSPESSKLDLDNYQKYKQSKARKEVILGGK